MTEPTNVPGTVASRAERRVKSPRKRILIGLAGALALVLAVVLGVVLLSGGGSSDTAKKAVAVVPSSTTTTTTIPPTTTTTIPPPAQVATTKVASLQVFDGPDSPKVVTSLSAKT